MARRLDPAIRVAKLREEAAQAALGAAERQRIDADEALRQQRARISAERESAQRLLAGDSERWFARAAEQAEMLANSGVLAGARADAARQRLIDANARRQALEQVAARQRALLRAKRDRAAETAAADRALANWSKGASPRS